MKGRSSSSMRSSSSSLRSGSPTQRFLSPSPSPTSRRSFSPSDDFVDFLDTPKSHRRRRTSGRKVRASQVVNPDVIDRLDTASRFSYHHEGPYDAVYAERNKHIRSSPLDALRESNEEALKATPPYMVADAIGRRRPLDGVAYYPSGYTDREGQTYDYQEGPNMMVPAPVGYPPARGLSDSTLTCSRGIPTMISGMIRSTIRRRSRFLCCGTFSGESPDCHHDRLPGWILWQDTGRLYSKIFLWFYLTIAYA